MTKTKKIASAIMGIVLMTGTGAFAQQVQPQQQTQQPQQEVSDQELKQFAAASQEVQVLQQKAQEKMVAAVEKEGLEVQRFTELQQAQQDPAQKSAIDAAEMKKFQSANEKLGQIQTDTQAKMQARVLEKGLTINRFQEISAIMQANPELQQKMQQLLQG